MSNGFEAIRSVTSLDGTTIGYRQLGNGPGLVLVHGGGQSSHNLLNLATLMSDRFTVYVPDRRGRAMSGPYREGHGLRVEVEDLGALLQETGARNVFGHSIGALIAIEAARSLPGISKLALYEPPLAFEGVSQTSWVPRYESELRSGRLAAATVTIMKGTVDRTMVRYVPRTLLVPAVKRFLRQPPATGAVATADLIRTMHFEALTVNDAAGPLARFADLACDVLLLGGEKSALNVTAALNGLSAVLPKARKVIFRGVGHQAPTNGAKPDEVAESLRDFFI